MQDWVPFFILCFHGKVTGIEKSRESMSQEKEEDGCFDPLTVQLGEGGLVLEKEKDLERTLDPIVLQSPNSYLRKCPLTLPFCL